MKMRASFAALVAGSFASLAPNHAEACGGFFCANAPIDQNGERIVFTVAQDGWVEAHVQITYVGDARSFSWVVPTEAQPTLSVGSPMFFQVLSRATQPRFFLEWQQSSCNSSPLLTDRVAAGEPNGGAEGSAGADGGVTVISQEEVGPYDAAILQATDAKALTDWLDQNGYVLTPQGKDALTPYVGSGYYFVALKLQQDKGVGDLRPIVLRMNTGRPCIPIRLTAIAARPNMPIIAWVFAEHRAVPQNYKHVLVNLTKVDWLRGGSNYNQVATNAVDEAGGHAFLTEFAGKVSSIAPQLSALSRSFDLARLRSKTHPVDYWQELLNQGLNGDPSMLSLLRKYIPMPQSLVGKVSEAAFYNNLSAYRSHIDNDPGRAPFDYDGFTGEIDETIVKPLTRAKEIVSNFPYLTRLYTTMSAEEMTVDPEFQFNPDVPDVSNVHRAKASMVCNVYDADDRKVRIELEDGRYFFVPMSGGGLAEGPDAERVEAIGTSGPPVVLADNASAIANVLRKNGGGSPKSGGCSSAGSLVPIALLALVGLARRPSRTRSSPPHESAR